LVFFDILTPEDQIAANLTPINDVCRVVCTCQPVLTTASAAHLADGERLISNEKYIFEFEYIYIGTE